MKIYFAAAIRAGRENAHIFKELVKFLSKFGKVMTEHVGDLNLSDRGEDRSPEYIYKRDAKWIKESDLFVAEVSTPSTGVGYEVCYAEGLNKPIICLYSLSSAKKISGMIEGNKNIKLVNYSDLASLEIKLEKELSKYAGKIK